MAARGAHVFLPEDLVREVDEIVGSRGRTAFLADLVRREIKRRHLLDILKREEPIWKDEDHPELLAGAAEWVRKMRTESEDRYQDIELQRKRD